LELLVESAKAIIGREREARCRVVSGTSDIFEIIAVFSADNKRRRARGNAQGSIRAIGPSLYRGRAGDLR
jgi:hypothetical protein